MEFKQHEPSKLSGTSSPSQWGTSGDEYKGLGEMEFVPFSIKTNK
jgi:hypothetical protein